MGARKFLGYFVRPLRSVGFDISEGMADVSILAGLSPGLLVAELEDVLPRILRVVPLRVLCELCVYPPL